jgi:hypothetical protein
LVFCFLNAAKYSNSSNHQIKESKGSGDTFDVSWSSDGSLLSSCFSSGNLIILDALN